MDTRQLLSLTATVLHKASCVITLHMMMVSHLRQLMEAPLYMEYLLDPLRRREVRNERTEWLASQSGMEDPRRVDWGVLEVGWRLCRPVDMPPAVHSNSYFLVEYR